MNKTLESFELPNLHKFEIVSGDITKDEVDAIVNAANKYLKHGGGLAAVIVRNGGKIIQSESDGWIKDHGPITHNSPAYTSSGNLPCKYIIHAAGPIWGEGDEEQKLFDTLQGILRLADKLKLTSLAIPAISTGIFSFPKDKAAFVIYNSIYTYFNKQRDSKINIVRLTLFDQSTINVFIDIFNTWRTNIVKNNDRNNLETKS